MRRLLVVPIAVAVSALPAAAQTAPGLAGSWVGGMSFGRPAGTAALPVPGRSPSSMSSSR